MIWRLEFRRVLFRSLELQFFQCLADARYVAVTEDAPDAGEERLLDAVALDILLGDEFHDGLRHRHARRLDSRRHLFPFQTRPRLAGQPPCWPVDPLGDLTPGRKSSIEIVAPGLAHPGIGRIIAWLHGPHRLVSGEDVQVVPGVALCDGEDVIPL